MEREWRESGRTEDVKKEEVTTVGTGGEETDGEREIRSTIKTESG